METTTVERTCIVCRLPSRVTVDVEDFKRWRSGEYVQDVWPHWSAAEREKLLTGSHPECWTELFGDDDEEE